MPTLRIKKRILFIALMLGAFGCIYDSKETSVNQPNILWLVAEDLGPYIPAFGDGTVRTPNLSRLAAEGVCYTRVFSVSGVCSPSRATLATGMYPTSIGAHHMRTLYQQPAAKARGIINYECVPPPEVKMVSQIMRESGYYCTNNAKEDYQFHPSKMAWDESSIYAHWRNRPVEQPFFSVFNFGVTHESNLWNPFGRTYDLDSFPPARELKKWWLPFQNVSKPLFVSQDLSVQIPPYLPETEPVRNDMLRMYSNIVEMDQHVGRVINQLIEDDLLESTVIIWYTDHGGPLPRQKRLLYDSGLRVPMIIRFPKKCRAGEVDEQLISFVDFAPTILSLASIQAPTYMHGIAFAGKYKEAKPRKYIHASADRFDESYDMIRAVRDKQYKYLRNFFPERPYYLALEYREKMASMQELLRLQSIGKLNHIQSQWFRKSKPREELFDTENDPHELYNLADDAQLSDKLIELRAECDRWITATSDKGHLNEKELINQFWPNAKQPETARPQVKKDGSQLIISCKTPGASIGYKLDQDHKPGIGWRVYTSPIQIQPKGRLWVIAHRLGYAPSDTLIYRKR